MTMQTISYNSGYLHYTTVGNVTTIRAQNNVGESRVFTSERAAKAWLRSYQGHKNYNHWNVSLYINNEYVLYKMAQEWVTPGCGLTLDQQAAGMLNQLHSMGMTRTVDGVRYTVSTIKETLRSLSA